MTSALHRAKEGLESRLGLRIRRQAGFPYLAAERRFLDVRMDLSNKCNLRCRMCYFSLDEVWKAPLVEMSDGVIERIVAEVWPRTRNLWLSCASEPLIARKLKTVLPRAKQAGVPQVHLITNALALTDAKIDILLDGGLDRLDVSIDGAAQETYEAIRRLSDFRRVVGNLERLRERKRERGSGAPVLTILVVMMLENMAEWADIVRLAADLGAADIAFIPQTYYTELDPTQGLWNHQDAVNAAMGEARRAAKECGIEIGLPDAFSDAEKEDAAAAAPAPCLLPWDGLVIYSNGDVTPCTTMFSRERFGNLGEQSFPDIYWGPAFRSLRERHRSGRLGPVCLSCPVAQCSDLSKPEAFTPQPVVSEPNHAD